MGFLLGSVIGGLLSFIDFEVGNFTVNSLTAPGYFSFLIGIFNLLLVIYQLKDLDKSTTANVSVTGHELGDHINLKPDKIAVIISMILWFVGISSFSIIETIITPYLDYVYEWSIGEISLVFASGSLIALTAFATIHKTKKIHPNPERYLLFLGMLIGGFGLIFAGGLMFYIPEIWEWLTGMILFFIGHPFAMASTLSLYSKICGPQKQGIYMGYVTAIGSLGRIVSPLWSSSLLIAENYDGIWTFSSTGLLMWLSAILTIIYWKKLVPHPMQKISINQTQYGHISSNDTNQHQQDVMYNKMEMDHLQ